MNLAPTIYFVMLCIMFRFLSEMLRFYSEIDSRALLLVLTIVV